MYNAADLSVLDQVLLEEGYTQSKHGKVKKDGYGLNHRLQVMVGPAMQSITIEQLEAIYIQSPKSTIKRLKNPIKIYV